MAMLRIGNPGDDVKSRLREDEAGGGLADTIRSRFTPFGDNELQLPERDLPRDPPDFTGGAAAATDAA